MLPVKSNGKVSIYENACLNCTKRGHLVETIQDYGPEFHVEFKTRIYEVSYAWYNILYISRNSNRYPAVMIWGPWLEFTSHLNGKRVAKWYGPAKQGEEYHIVVSQKYNNYNQLVYKVTVNGNLVQSLVNGSPISKGPAKLYLTDPNHATIQDIGEVYDVVVISGSASKNC